MRAAWAIVLVIPLGWAVACATAGGANQPDASTVDSGGGGDGGGGCPQFDLQTDPKHCGSCTNACSSQQVCSNGACKSACDPPLTQCIGDAGASCVDLKADQNHCGTCTTVCTGADAGVADASSGNPDSGVPQPDGGVDAGSIFVSSGTPSCAASTCGITCPQSMTACSDGYCYDTQDFHDRCGDCNTTCGAAQYCTKGHCCDPGTAYCGSSCIDVLGDKNNCGGCGIVCGSGAPVCSVGQCTTAITYTGNFVNGGTPTTQCTDWNTFRASLTGTYTSVTIKGTFDTTGRTCSGANANTICQALHNGSTVTALSCGGYGWSVDACTGLELTADSMTCYCTNPGWNVRPCITNYNWGGVNTTSCNTPPTQTITVSCQ